MASEIRVTNIKANDGTSSLTVANSTGAVTTGQNLAVGGTLTSTGAITASGGIANAGTLGAGTLGSSVVFPAGHVLQIKNHYTTSGVGTTSTNLTNYSQSNGSFSSDATSPWGNITTKQANSSLLFFLTTAPYFDDGIVSGVMATVNLSMVYSTNSDLSSSTTTSNIIKCYEDCRSTMNVSGQQQGSAAGNILVTTSYASGTTVYYTVKVHLADAAIYEYTTLQVMEVAT
jgi:hypothetical protein